MKGRVRPGSDGDNLQVFRRLKSFVRCKCVWECAGFVDITFSGIEMNLYVCFELRGGIAVLRAQNIVDEYVPVHGVDINFREVVDCIVRLVIELDGNFTLGAHPGQCNGRPRDHVRHPALRKTARRTACLCLLGQSYAEGKRNNGGDA